MIGASWFNQPWLAEKLDARDAPAAARQARPLRLRRQELRRRRGAARPPTSRRSTPRASRCRRRSCATSSRVALAQVGRYLPDALPAELDEPLRRATRSRRSTSRATRRRRRRRAAGWRSTSCSRCSSSSPRSRDEDAVATALARAGRARRPLPRRAAVRADRAPGARDRRDRPRPRRARRRCSGCSRVTSAPGKTVVALYALLRAVESDRQGALMAPTETLAEQHFLTLEPLCAAARRALRPAHGLRRLEEDPRRDRERRRADRGGHARAARGRQAPVLLRSRSRSWTNSTGSGCGQRAALAAKGVLAARPRAGHAHPAHAPARLLRGPRPECDPWPAPGSRAARDPPDRRVEVPERGSGSSWPASWRGGAPGVRRRARHRGGQARRPARPAAETEIEHLRAQPLLARFRLGLLHGKLKPDDKQAVMEAGSGAASWTCSSPPP